MSDIRLQERVRQIRKDLGDWVEAEGILRPGERLVVSIYVERIPAKELVEALKEVLSTPLTEFFSPQQLTKAGASMNLVGRILRVLKRIAPDKTLGQFLKKYRTNKDLDKVIGLGTGAIVVISRILAAHDIKFYVGQQRENPRRFL